MMRVDTRRDNFLHHRLVIEPAGDFERKQACGKVRVNG